jgi:hypothetical protein
LSIAAAGLMREDLRRSLHLFVRSPSDDFAFCCSFFSVPSLQDDAVVVLVKV